MANALGKIVGSVTVRRYSVRLDDGTDVEAILSKSVLRKLGCLFGLLKDGLIVTVSLHDPPKQHRIIAVTNARKPNTVLDLDHDGPCDLSACRRPWPDNVKPMALRWLRSADSSKRELEGTLGNIREL